MFTIDFGRDAREFERAMQTFGRDAKWAAVVATNKVAGMVKERLTAELPSIFDRPTPFTMRSMFVRRASMAKLFAEVGFKDFAAKGTPATKYLRPQVDGGPRRAKRFERLLQSAGILPSGWFAMPGDNAELDAFGNMSRGQLTKALSHIRSFAADRGQNRSQTRKSRGKRRKEQYFAAKPGNPGLAPGIYKRAGAKGRDAQPVLFFVRKAPTYRKRFPFDRITAVVVKEHLLPEFRTALEQAVATSRARGFRR